MSTFDGLMAEFPDIRIDFFRTNPSARPPLACFLSHVHSDHLAGLESLRSPFVYCSHATREILLRLERYPCRINFAKGVLEARQQTFKHLHKVLKPLPLETPTCLELQPGHNIQVTLLDANHCPGAVMFLIENDTHAILYTGDIRCEPWHVNALSRNPCLIEYTHGLKALDKIYLDTSFTSNVAFQTKAEGIAELIRKVSKYPTDTKFHFQAWTYGYEDVWIALSKVLGSRVHVDDYKMKIYKALQIRPLEGRFSSSINLSPEAPSLVGYMCGNLPHRGCLTSDTSVRLHSCEKGNMCSVAKGSDVVRIQPIVAHLPGGADLTEMGVGGGGDDLEREAEIGLLTHEELKTLIDSVGASGDFTQQVQDDIAKFLTQTSSLGRSLSLDLDISTLSGEYPGGLKEVISAIAKKSHITTSNTVPSPDADRTSLPRTITFPYSRHSSYPELCHLVRTFKPKDVWPCTVNIEAWLRDDISISSLFGKFCSGSGFAHDIKMQNIAANMSLESQPQNLSTQEKDSQLQDSSQPNPNPSQEPPSTPSQREKGNTSTTPINLISPEEIAKQTCTSRRTVHTDDTIESPRFISMLPDCSYTEYPSGTKRGYEEYVDSVDDQDEDDAGESQQTEKSFSSTLSMRHSTSRRQAYYQMLEWNGEDGWGGIGLLSTDGSHTIPEKEL